MKLHLCKEQSRPARKHGVQSTLPESLHECSLQKSAEVKNLVKGRFWYTLPSPILNQLHDILSAVAPFSNHLWSQNLHLRIEVLNRWPRMAESEGAEVETLTGSKERGGLPLAR